MPASGAKTRPQLVPVTTKLPSVDARTKELTDFLAIPTRTSTPTPDDTLLTGQSPRARAYSESSVEDDLFKSNGDTANSSYHGLDIEALYADVVPADVPDDEMTDTGSTKP